MTREEIVVRDLEWTDLELLVSLEEQLFPDDAWSLPMWWAELAERPRRDYVTAVGADGSVRGYAGINHAGEVADVMTLAVAPAAQGQGLGGILLRALVERATARGATAILLEVRADNAAARALYDRHGFRTIRVRRRYYQPGDVDALVMRLLLQEDSRG